MLYCFFICILRPYSYEKSFQARFLQSAIHSSRNFILSSVWNQCSPFFMTVIGAAIRFANSDIVSYDVKLSPSPYKINVRIFHFTAFSPQYAKTSEMILLYHIGGLTNNKLQKFMSKRHMTAFFIFCHSSEDTERVFEHSCMPV